MSEVSGTIFQVQRWSVHDGDGIRSTVFLKGCPLRCKWCANPESWNSAPEVLLFRERCTGCGRCAKACSLGAAGPAGSTGGGGPREKCGDCGKCGLICPTGARKIIGATATVSAVLQAVGRDAIFYRESGGGVTFSGGEPFAQPEFLRHLVLACRRQGIDTAVETSGYFDWEQVKDIVAQLGSVFFDIKHMDDAVHQELTGVSNRRILANIAWIAADTSLTTVRVPLLAGVNDGEKNIREMCEFLRRHAPVKGVEILPYHDYGQAKRPAVGAEAQAFAAPDADRIAAVKELIAGYGINVIDFD